MLKGISTSRSHSIHQRFLSVDTEQLTILKVRNIQRLMKAVRDLDVGPRQDHCTFLLDIEVLDGPFWYGVL